MGKTEITRGQFAAFVSETGYNTGDKCWVWVGKFEEHSGQSWRDPGYRQDDNHPVACISWNDAKAYAEWISRKTGKQYRLPSESEWEYAARSNTSTARYWGDNPDQACGYANGADSTAQTQLSGVSSWVVHNCTDGYAYTAPVGSFKSNAFGLYDMLGNLGEWVEDTYHNSYIGAPIDGIAWQGDGAKRTLRGFGWSGEIQDVRVAKGEGSNPASHYGDTGFRLARSLP
jgi:formylglycine-generating enzyme required for sulfatase activity